MSRLTRDGRAKSLSRNQFFRRERGQGNFPWSADHVNRIGNLLVDLYSAICYDNSSTVVLIFQYSSTNISYLNILYIVEGVGKIYGCRRGHREQSRE